MKIRIKADIYGPNVMLVRVASKIGFSELSQEILMTKMHLALVAQSRINVTTFFKKFKLKIYLDV